MKRLLYTLSQVLFSLCMLMMGYLYIENARNFGKPHPAYWGMAAIAAAIFLLYALFARYPVLIRLACLVLAVIQLPPIWCWMAISGPFEFTGVMMVPNWLGLTVHVLFLAWSVGNHKLFTRFQQEDDLIRHAQSA